MNDIKASESISDVSTCMRSYRYPRPELAMKAVGLYINPGRGGSEEGGPGRYTVAVDVQSGVVAGWSKLSVLSRHAHATRRLYTSCQAINVVQAEVVEDLNVSGGLPVVRLEKPSVLFKAD